MTSTAKRLQPGKYEYRGYIIRKNDWKYGPAFPVWEVFHAPKDEYACLSIHKVTQTRTRKEAKEYISKLHENSLRPDLDF